MALLLKAMEPTQLVEVSLLDNQVDQLAQAQLELEALEEILDQLEDKLADKPVDLLVQLEVQLALEVQVETQVEVQAEALEEAPVLVEMSVKVWDNGITKLEHGGMELIPIGGTNQEVQATGPDYADALQWPFLRQVSTALG